MDYLCNWKSEKRNVCKVAEGHCLQHMIIMHHYANGCFDWLISGQHQILQEKQFLFCLGNTKNLSLFMLWVGVDNSTGVQSINGSALGEPMFSLCRKWRKFAVIAKSRDASMDNKEFSSFLKILMKQNSFLF